MIPVLSREQMRDFDRHAIDECGVPGVLLMENAGRAAADVIAERYDPGGLDLLVLCGSGNNGGDGFVVARHLLARGADVTVLLTTEIAKLSGDAAVMAAAWVGVGGTTFEKLEGSARALKQALLIVDALFGTGLSRDLSGSVAKLVKAANQAAAPIVALDIPSGLDSNTGAVLGVSVQAALTVTFAFPLMGAFSTAAVGLSGELVVVDIGVPSSLGGMPIASARWQGSHDVAALLPARAPDTHKGSAGRVVAFAGSAGMTGAALLVGAGALRCGAGLVTLCSSPEAMLSLERRVLELMTAAYDSEDIAGSVDKILDRAAAVVVGPGLGQSDTARELSHYVTLNFPGPVVLDADGITHFCDEPQRLREAKGPIILTPHSGEMARLLGVSIAEVEADRMAALQKAVELTASVVLLKGPRTLIGVSGSLPVVNSSGCAALATAGSGDVLAGIIAALATKLSPVEAARVGAHLHGLCGEAWATGGQPGGMLAHEIADWLPRVWADLTR